MNSFLFFLKYLLFYEIIMLLYGRVFFSFVIFIWEKKNDNIVFNLSHEVKSFLILEFYMLRGFWHVKGRGWWMSKKVL